MHMDEQLFADRLAELRLRKNVSAREMSLAIGQNPSYINRIENRLSYPSMQVFFYICEYLGITPKEFFDGGNTAPERRRELHGAVERLTVRDQRYDPDRYRYRRYKSDRRYRDALSAQAGALFGVCSCHNSASV